MSEPYTYRCNRCHRPMIARTAAEEGCHMGACECGGLIEATPQANPEPTIYEQMLAAGVEIDHHESDLYVPATEVTNRILALRALAPTTYAAQHANVGRIYGVTVFWHDGAPWYDVPFAYDPFWARKDGGAA